MLIKALLQRRSQNLMYPNLPTSSGNTASYVVVVRQNGIVVEGQYTLSGVPPSDYSSVICIYYTDNVEISRSETYAKPGSCTVSDARTPGVTKLEIRVIGIYSAPTGGSIALDGTYSPTRTLSNYGSIFGGQNSEICTKMSVNPSNMPSGQIQIDSSTGALTWSIALKRFDRNSILRLQNVVVSALSTSIGTITITPYARQNGVQNIQLNSISGQANSPITGFPNDYSVDIFSVLVTMFPSYAGISIDPSQIIVTVDYCFTVGISNALPTLSGIQPYNTQNAMDNSYNQPTRMFILFFLTIFY
jgi:hypothetical protein